MSLLTMDDLEGMGVFGFIKEAIRLMRQHFDLFITFVTSFTIPCSIFTVFLASGIDIHKRYVIGDFISKGELVIFGWRFETLISPLALNLGFTILNLLPVAVLNTVVCTRGVVTIYRNEDLATSTKNSYIDLQWVALRILATQSIIYSVLVLSVAVYLLFPESSSYVVFAAGFVVLLYPIPASQVAVLERRNYGFRGVYRAMKIAVSRLSTTVGLAFLSLSYFVLLKLLVDLLLKNSYPFWTKFLVYPPLVVSIIAMSIFWQVVYTLFYLSNVHVDLDNVDLIQPAAENRGPDIHIHQPLLDDEVARSD